VCGVGNRETITDHRADELFDRIVAGDSVAINEYVDGMMKIAVRIAAGYAAVMPRMSDDIVSAATLAILESVENAKAGNMRDRNIKAATVSHIHSNCGNVRNIRPVYGPVNRTEKRTKKKMRRRDVDSLHLANTSPENQLADVREAASLVCDERQLRILEGLVEGRTMLDIGEQLGISESVVSRSWKAAIVAIRNKLDTDAKARIPQSLSNQNLR